MPYFSILIPVCNQEGKMDACFDSLKNQTFKDFEVIFVDDGSKDNSLHALQEYVKIDKRARIIEHGDNKSLLYARWTAMGEARGKYVVFLDSDDALTYDALEKLHAHFESTGDDAVRFGFRFKNKKVDMLPPEHDDMLTMYFTGFAPPAIWKNAYSIEVIKKSHDTINPFYCNMAEDSFYAAVFFTNAIKVGIMKDVIYIYTDDSGMSSERKNLSLDRFKKALTDLENSGKHFIEYIEKYNPKYKELALKQSLRIKRFLVLQYVLYEDDFNKIYDILTVLKQNGDEDAFNYCFTKLMEMKAEIRSGKKPIITYDLDIK